MRTCASSSLEALTALESRVLGFAARTDCYAVIRLLLNRAEIGCTLHDASSGGVGALCAAAAFRAALGALVAAEGRWQYLLLAGAAIGLAALTVPHVILVDGMFRRNDAKDRK